MPAEQFWRGQVHQAAIILVDQPAPLDADMPSLACRMQRCACAVRLRFDHGHRLDRLLRRDHRHVALDDRGLLCGDRGQGIAEEFGMIHADRREHGCQRRLDDIGRVEPPAEPDFQ